MKSFCIKLAFVILVLFAVFEIEAIFIKNSMQPRFEYASLLNLSNRKYLKPVQSATDFKEIMLFENDLIPVHLTLHENEDAVFECQENGDRKCYLSASVIDINSENDFFGKCLILGKLPNDKFEIAINKNLAKRLKISVGDLVLLKFPFFSETVKISGIFRNLYGFDEFNAEKKFYCALNRGEKYLASVRGNIFVFSDSDKDSFSSYSVKKIVADFRKELAFDILIIFFLLFVFLIISYQSYKKILQLKKYHARLFSLGKTSLFVKKERFKEVLIFFLLCLGLIFLSSFLGGGYMLLLLNLAALFFSSIINYFWSK